LAYTVTELYKANLSWVAPITTTVTVTVSGSGTFNGGGSGTYSVNRGQTYTVVATSSNTVQVVYSISPRTATTPAAWWRAGVACYSDTGTTSCVSGSTIEQANDISGNGNNATQSSSGARPTLTTDAGYLPFANQLGISFTGSSSQYLQHSCTQGTGTFVLVGRCTLMSADTTFMGIKAPSGGVAGPYFMQAVTAANTNVCTFLETQATGTQGSVAPTINTAIGGYCVSVPFIMIGTIGSGTASLYLNGVLSNSVSYSAVCASGTVGYLGATWYNGSVVNFLTGYIYEAAIYSSVLGSTEMASLVADLRADLLPSAPPSAIYAMSTFNGATTEEETTIVATSSDGKNFQQYGASYVPGYANSNPTTFRDPCLINYNNFWLEAYTSNNFVSSTYTGMCFSSDLAFWQGLPNINWGDISGVTQVWAPRLFVDPNSGNMYCVAAINKGTVNTGNFSVYYKQATGFNGNGLPTTWSNASAITASSGSFPTTTIDPCFLYFSGTYYLFFKNQGTSQQWLGYATNSSFGASGWTVVVNGTANTLGLGEGEGPSFAYIGGILTIYFDQLTSGGATVVGESYSVLSSGPTSVPYASPTLCIGTAIGGGSFTPRHGTVLSYVPPIGILALLDNELSSFSSLGMGSI
jgi:hypothetical protein